MVASTAKVYNFHRPDEQNYLQTEPTILNDINKAISSRLYADKFKKLEELTNDYNLNREEAALISSAADGLLNQYLKRNGKQNRTIGYTEKLADNFKNLKEAVGYDSDAMKLEGIVKEVKHDKQEGIKYKELNDVFAQYATLQTTNDNTRKVETTSSGTKIIPLYDNNKLQPHFDDKPYEVVSLDSKVVEPKSSDHGFTIDWDRDDVPEYKPFSMYSQSDEIRSIKDSPGNTVPKSKVLGTYKPEVVKSIPDSIDNVVAFPGTQAIDPDERERVLADVNESNYASGGMLSSQTGAIKGNKKLWFSIGALAVAGIIAGTVYWKDKFSWGATNGSVDTNYKITKWNQADQMVDYAKDGLCDPDTFDDLRKKNIGNDTFAKWFVSSAKFDLDEKTKSLSMTGLKYHDEKRLHPYIQDSGKITKLDGTKYTWTNLTDAQMAAFTDSKILPGNVFIAHELNKVTGKDGKKYQALHSVSAIDRLCGGKAAEPAKAETVDLGFIPPFTKPGEQKHETSNARVGPDDFYSGWEQASADPKKKESEPLKREVNYDPEDHKGPGDIGGSDNGGSDPDPDPEGLSGEDGTGFSGN